MPHTSHVEFVLSTRQGLIRIKKFQFFSILLAYDTYLTIFICHAYLKKKKKKREKKSRFARYSAIMIVRRAPPRHPQRHPCYSSVTSLKVHNGRLFASRLCIVVVNTCRRFYQGRWRRPEKVVEEEESRTSLPQKGVIFP